MTNQIAVHKQESFAVSTLDEAMRYSQALAGAGIVPQSFQNQPANILVAQEIAKVLGESVWVIMSEMDIVTGRPSFSAKFMRSRVRQAGHKLRESYDKTTGIARAVIIRHDDPEFEHVAEWDRAKAEAHELWGKRHWKKNPELMLKNRALSECVREACYEVMGGMPYTTDEVQDFAPAPVKQQATVMREPEQTPQHRALEEIQADVDAANTREQLSALWKEATAAGYANLVREIERKGAALNQKQEEQQEPEPAPETMTAEDVAEAMDAEIVEDPAA